MLTYFKAIRPRLGFTVDEPLPVHTQRSYLQQWETMGGYWTTSGAYLSPKRCFLYIILPIFTCQLCLMSFGAQQPYSTGIELPLTWKYYEELLTNTCHFLGTGVDLCFFAKGIDLHSISQYSRSEDSPSYWASRIRIRIRKYLYGSGSFQWQEKNQRKNPWFVQFCDF